MINLGALYADGQGVTQDYAKAREWYEKAADQGQTRPPSSTSARSTTTERE